MAHYFRTFCPFCRLIRQLRMMKGVRCRGMDICLWILSQLIQTNHTYNGPCPDHVEYGQHDKKNMSASSLHIPFFQPHYPMIHTMWKFCFIPTRCVFFPFFLFPGLPGCDDPTRFSFPLLTSLTYLLARNRYRMTTRLDRREVTLARHRRRSPLPLAYAVLRLPRVAYRSQRVRSRK